MHSNRYYPPILVENGIKRLISGSHCINHPSSNAVALHAIFKYVDQGFVYKEREPVCYECKQRLTEEDDVLYKSQVFFSLIVGVSGILLIGIMVLFSS